MARPKILPPRSVVRVLKADAGAPAYRNAVGRQYRVGYYRRDDGLATIWLVDEDGNYFGTTDKEHLAKYCAIESTSDETDIFGDHRPLLRARRQTTSEDFLPPLTLLQLQHAVSLHNLRLITDQVGHYFRVGYYTPNDGLETIWIADEDGAYVGTIARRRLKKYFRVVSISRELDYCGTRAIDPLPERQRLEAARMRKMVGKRKGTKVFLKGLPPGLITGLPRTDQKAISEIVGKAIDLLGFRRDGRAELEFVDRRGDIHFIYVDPDYIRRV